VKKANIYIYGTVGLRLCGYIVSALRMEMAGGGPDATISPSRARNTPRNYLTNASVTGCEQREVDEREVRRRAKSSRKAFGRVEKLGKGELV
jgi:hypothetical protein